MLQRKQKSEAQDEGAGKTKEEPEEEQTVAMPKSEFDQMRSDQLALLSKFDQMLTKMTKLDDKVDQTWSKVEQTSHELNALKTSLEAKVKEEVLEISKEIGQDLAESQEEMRIKFEEDLKEQNEFSEKNKQHILYVEAQTEKNRECFEKYRKFNQIEINRFCDEKNDQHVRYLEEQTEKNRLYVEACTRSMYKNMEKKW